MHTDRTDWRPTCLSEEGTSELRSKGHRPGPPGGILRCLRDRGAGDIVKSEKMSVKGKGPLSGTHRGSVGLASVVISLFGEFKPCVSLPVVRAEPVWILSLSLSLSLSLCPSPAGALSLSLKNKQTFLKKRPLSGNNPGVPKQDVVHPRNGILFSPKEG